MRTVLITPTQKSGVSCHYFSPLIEAFRELCIFLNDRHFATPPAPHQDTATDPATIRIMPVVAKGQR